MVDFTKGRGLLAGHTRGHPTGHTRGFFHGHGHKVLVVGEPTAQERDGKPMLDRNTKQPHWSLDVTIIGTSRAETIQLTLPEGGFPKNIGIGAVIVPEEMVAVTWEKSRSRCPMKYGTAL